MSSTSFSSFASSFQFRSSVLGFPRFGSHRQLKTAVEAFWSGSLTKDALVKTAAELRAAHWALMAEKGIDVIPANDFSFYDHVLDHALLFGVIPKRVRQSLSAEADLDVYFAMARGLQRKSAEGAVVDVFACEMKKYFDSNYHYLVPEIQANGKQEFHLPKDESQIKPLQEFLQAKATGIAVERIRPVLLGPVTFLLLSKLVDEESHAEEAKSKAESDAHGCTSCASTTSNSSKDLLSYLPALLPVYIDLLTRLAAAGATSVQIDEPIFVTDLVSPALFASVIQPAYEKIRQAVPSQKLILATFYGDIAADVLESVLSLPVDGVHVDLIRGGLPSPRQGNSYYFSGEEKTNVENPFERLLAYISSGKRIPSILSLGVIDGRNIWRADLSATIEQLIVPVLQAAKEKLTIEIAPSCSLLHVPHSLAAEKKLDAEIKNWLAFAAEKLEELVTITRALKADESEAVKAALVASTAAVQAHRSSPRVVNVDVRAAVSSLTAAAYRRTLPHAERIVQQRAHLQIPLFPVTTIGSFPQTAELRRVRSQFRSGKITAAEYDEYIRKAIAECVAIQEELGIDVFVHGESERNDMVEFFGELLNGFVFTENGWVQSYGSRCVKPPILFGDVSRSEHQAMTVPLMKYAQSLTKKPMKAMLTGPVTMLQWSFVRDDQPRAETAKQLALAIRKEVEELEKEGLRIIQIDEAALREGLPLRHRDWAGYMQWSVDSFLLCSTIAQPQTQIHSHMCYSDFQDILPAIIRMDADVLTVENARSNSRIIQALKSVKYPNKLAPGIYDIHSPRVPDVEEMRIKAEELLTVLSKEQIELVPDCGLKTRQWKEVKAALTNLVTVAKQLREKYPAA